MAKGVRSSMHRAVGSPERITRLFSRATLLAEHLASTNLPRPSTTMTAPGTSSRLTRKLRPLTATEARPLHVHDPLTLRREEHAARLNCSTSLQYAEALACASTAAKERDRVGRASNPEALRCSSSSWGLPDGIHTSGWQAATPSFAIWTISHSRSKTSRRVTSPGRASSRI